MIKLIVSDLDGTLLDRNLQVSKADKDALRKAQESGYEICLASGRMFTELQIVMNACKGRFHAISQNGATIHTKDFAQLGSTYFDPELAVQLLKSSRLFQIENFIHTIDDTYYLTERTERSLLFESRVMVPGTERMDLESALQRNEIISCRFTYFGEIEELRLLQAELARLFQGKIDSYISDRDCLDVVPACVSKGAGLEVLVKHLGLKAHEVACIGDSFNDLPMFSFSPYSFAMITAPDEVQKEATYIVPSVAEAAKQIAAINDALEWK